jgi:hypothetical protein
LLSWPRLAAEPIRRNDQGGLVMKTRERNARLPRRARFRLPAGLTRRFFVIFLIIAIASAVAAYFANEKIEVWEHMYAVRSRAR